MTHTDHLQPARLPDPIGADLAPLFGALADAAAPARRVRSRLLGRVEKAIELGHGLITRRRARLPIETPAVGVSLRHLYISDAGFLRPGEPRRALWVELAPGASWALPAAPGTVREWLVLRGNARVGDVTLPSLGYFRGVASETNVSTDAGAALYLRWTDAEPAVEPQVSLDAPPAWQAYGPGIMRRLLWTDGEQAAMLYQALAGAAVPHHAHLLDEECLMVDGDLFLDDLLLRAGDYQLAPAGTEHHSVCTDNGGLLFAHGDLDLALRS